MRGVTTEKGWHEISQMSNSSETVCSHYLGFQSSPLGLMKDYINYLRKEAFRAAVKHVGYRLNAVRVGGYSFPLVIRCWLKHFFCFAIP